MIVTLSSGRLRGKSSLNHAREVFWSFLGVPYAEPPVGELRFRPPVPKKPWSGVRNATRLGPACPSNHAVFFYYTGKEKDCLHLNVYTKSTQPPLLRPVMVWIHGGAFVMGSNSPKVYGPQYLMTEDIVLVAVNYRLGVLGFLCLEDAALGVPGNAGLKDLVLALEWVQRNVHHFGGDADNVTIFGESAGSACVHFLCLSPMAQGLFHKAIAQSGCALNCWARGCPNGRLIGQCLGYKETEERDILAKLKRESPRRLVAAQRRVPLIWILESFNPFGPVVEKPCPSQPGFLLEEPVEALKRGAFHQVPLIIGYNSAEGIMYRLLVMVMPKLKAFTCLNCIIPHDLHVEKDSPRSRELVEAMRRMYKPSSDSDPLVFFKIKTDSMFSHGILRTVAYQKRHSLLPIYLYRMSADTVLNFPKRASVIKCPYVFFLVMFLVYKCSACRPSTGFYRLLERLCPLMQVEGACHGDDIGYLFRSFASPKLKRDSVEEVCVKRFVRMWTDFAKTGNPTPAMSEVVDVKWRPVTQKMNHFLEIGSGGLRMGENPDRERMKFWDSVYGV